MKTKFWSISGLVLIGVLGWAAPVGAQEAAPPAPQKRPATTPRATAVVDPDQVTAPQVVTILHRLNGLKLFRLIARENQELGAIAQVDEAFKIMDEVHTNVIAGLAMNDGQTIVTRLPEVEAELGSPAVPFISASPVFPSNFPGFVTTTKPSESPGVDDASKSWDQPDVTVITRDGRRFLARYIGLDGVTGLSVLKLIDKTSLPVLKPKVEAIRIGQHLRLFAPEPAPPRLLSGKISVRIGELEGTITNITPTPSGAVSRMRIRAAGITAANIGGVAINDAGETVGIIDSIDQVGASLISTTQISNAARRVLARQANVPKPWLGVSGEPIEALVTNDLINSGWQKQQATALAEDRCGILLTAVTPDSPAAIASLRSGDVILRVNGEDIRTADDFSWLLSETGPGNSATFTVMRPGQEAPETINLKLSGGFNQRLPAAMQAPPFMKRALLLSKGIETVALMPPVAARFGASGGLLVIYVEPQTAAFSAGLRPGDVIETINGRQISNGVIDLTNSSTTELKFEIVRRKEKMIFMLPNDSH